MTSEINVDEKWTFIYSERPTVKPAFRFSGEESEKNRHPDCHRVGGVLRNLISASARMEGSWLFGPHSRRDVSRVAGSRISGERFRGNCERMRESLVIHGYAITRRSIDASWNIEFWITASSCSVANITLGSSSSLRSDQAPKLWLVKGSNSYRVNLVNA